MKGWQKGVVGALFMAVASQGVVGCAGMPDYTMTQQQGGVYTRGPMDLPGNGVFRGSQPTIIHPDGTIQALPGKGRIDYGAASSQQRRDSTLDSVQDQIRDVDRTVNSVNRAARTIDRLGDTLRNFGF